MAFRIMPEFDRNGRASARTGSRATVIRLPKMKKRLHPSEVWVGTPGHTPPFLLKRENQGEGDVGPRANKIYSN